MDQNTNEIINQTPAPAQKAKGVLLPMLSKLNIDKFKPKHFKIIIGGTLSFIFILILFALVFSASSKDNSQTKLPEAPQIVQLSSPSPILSPQAQKVAEFAKNLDESSFQSKLTEPIVDLDFSFEK